MTLRSAQAAGGRPPHLARVLSHAAVAAALALFTWTTAARAQNQAGSSAFAESVSLQVLPLLGSPVQVSSGPLPAVAGSAPPAYNLTGELASIRVAAPALGTLLETDLLTVDAASTEPDADQV